MRADRTALGVLCALTALLTGSRGARVVSGQTVCQGGPEKPCYKIAYFRDMTSRVAFNEALRACEVDGGSLLSVENVSEQRHIEHLLQELSNSSTGSRAGRGPSIADGDFWIGLTRADSESTQEHGGFAHCPDLYRWTDGSVSDFRNWYYDEPSCGGEACVVMYHQPTALHGLGGPYLYQWNDDRCNMKHNFICKYEPESHLEKEHGDRPGGHDAGFPEEHVEKKKTPAVNEDESQHVMVAGTSSMLLIYVIIPTIPLLLLILVASGTCCFQMLSKRKPRTKTTVNQSTLWISKTAKSDSAMEV
ncbi:chondrolectin isoform X1 [Astyanax mexicanus]|uniref:Chondrolectin isoform X1 n=2 Tax=Astyanax mexicanus TaxID=7994 RepID=A0A8B9JZ16_ASTMX|nr:chondrolectin isoform X1 [Astyanax mexicanus]KAG9283361.1 chondrolectin isoform X1 [Astyanax mexicanus]